MPTDKRQTSHLPCRLSVRTATGVKGNAPAARISPLVPPAIQAAAAATSWPVISDVTKHARVDKRYRFQETMIEGEVVTCYSVESAAHSL